MKRLLLAAIIFAAATQAWAQSNVIGGGVYGDAKASGGGFSLALTSTMVDNSGTGLGSFTFTSQSFGTVDATRQMIAAIAIQPSGGVADPTSVTIGGVSATLVPSSNNSSGVTDVSQWIASVPTRSTSPVVVAITP